MIIRSTENENKYSRGILTETKIGYKTDFEIIGIQELGQYRFVRVIHTWRKTGGHDKSTFFSLQVGIK